MSKSRPPCQRYLQIYGLVRIEGRTPEDVAAELGLKPSTVANVCSRVRCWMRRYWPPISAATHCEARSQSRRQPAPRCE
jgi:DNA-directed RNA polymerase specialized sigma24 family protein